MFFDNFRKQTKPMECDKRNRNTQTQTKKGNNSKFTQNPPSSRFILNGANQITGKNLHIVNIRTKIPCHKTGQSLPRIINESQFSNLTLKCNQINLFLNISLNGRDYLSCFITTTIVSVVSFIRSVPQAGTNLSVQCSVRNLSIYGHFLSTFQ